jgi:PEP-CTERM motif
MFRRSLGIAGICGALALTCAIQANAAKSIRQDMNQWASCPVTAGGESNPCVALPDVSFDPFGSGMAPTATTDKDDADVFGNDFGRELQYGWQSSVPGLDLRYLSAFGQAQVLYFGLGEGDLSELVYPPDFDFQFNDEGDLDPQSALLNRPGTWEIAFNYNFTDSTISPDAFSASLTWDGVVYSAPYSVLNSNEWNTFVYYGPDPDVAGSTGHLYVPTGWSTPGASVPEPGTLLLLLIGIAGLIGTRFLKRPRPAAALTAA